MSVYPLIDQLQIWMRSKPWFWRLRATLGKIAFISERSFYRRRASLTKAKDSALILCSFTWVSLKSLLWVISGLAGLIFVEQYLRDNWDLLTPLSKSDAEFHVDQLRLYAQLLTAIFSIYFATIGIILSAGYTRLRRDIIQMLTNEQVGSVYSRVLVLAAMFCLSATALPSFRFEPGLMVYGVGTIMTLLSALALFPLGQRLFNFFNLNVLVHSEIIPRIARHIEGAANPRNSISLANHHSRAARHALEQLAYIDDRITANNEGLNDNLPMLTDDYTALLLHYIQQKHRIDRDSYWFPRRTEHRQWFFAGDTVTSMALETSNQQLLVEEKPDHQWFETQVIDRLSGHIEQALKVGNFELALKLLNRFSTRASAYAAQFQFDLGMRELNKFKAIIEHALATDSGLKQENSSLTKVGIADAWAALGIGLSQETFCRMLTFEEELERFFNRDVWTKRSMRSLPAFMQGELAFIVELIEFEELVEGHRLSKAKYVQQLAVQKVLQNYAGTLQSVCEFCENSVPDFITRLTERKMSEAATQVVLASLHSYWTLPRWIDQIAILFERYRNFNHYKEAQYAISDIEVSLMSERFAALRDAALTKLGSGPMVRHVFEQKDNNEFPDHFGQIYFELAEACVSALEHNDLNKLKNVLPMFIALAFLASETKFTDPALNVHNEFRLHLISTVVNDLASILGFAILYGAYFDNADLPDEAFNMFDRWLSKVTDRDAYLQRMILLSDPHSFSIAASPRSLLRINWRMSFERRVRQDGFGDRMGRTRGEQHANKIVREFLNSTSEASHLFFALRVLPDIDEVGSDIDHRITRLARRLNRNREKTNHEDS